MHSPGFLADWSWLTFGRVRPAHLNTMVYGFASQAGIGVAIWLLCRLSYTVASLQGSSMAIRSLNQVTHFTHYTIAHAHISEATNINFQATDFAKQIAALPKDKTYLLHCASGNRARSRCPC